MGNRRAWPVLAIAGWLSACSGVASAGDAEKEIAAFHKQLDAEQYARIWQESGKDMQNASPQPVLVKLLSAVHRKLGRVVASKEIGWNSNVSTSGSFAQVQMATTFEHGKGLETFVYRKVGDQLQLVGYNINSNDMMTS